MSAPKDLRELEKLQPPPVELTFSRRCWHGCFTITAGYGAIWQFPGIKRKETRPGQPIVVHISSHGMEGEYDDCQKDCFRP
jgi:hypothetical protein